MKKTIAVAAADGGNSQSASGAHWSKRVSTQGYTTDMMKRVLFILLAVVVVAGLLLFLGPLVRGLTIGALMAGLIWYGLAGPYLRGRHGRAGPYLTSWLPTVTIDDSRAPDQGAGVPSDGSDWAPDGPNGFRNKQTWLVAGWLSNEGPFRNVVVGMARQERVAHDLGLRIRAYVGEHLEPGLVDDLSVVDWDAIGAAWLKKTGESERTQR